MTGALAHFSSIAELRQHLTSAPGPIGLVPTMGALHEGHGRLIDAARRECGTVVVSIFVNPLQFDREDDLRRYPRTLEADMRRCARHDADVVFAPEAAGMYPQPLACRINVGSMAEHLCGAFRPGHFDGVATVVLKLFEIVGPGRAYFGEKDAQQLAIIRRMVSDFNLPVSIAGVPTVREADGLAMSSRNVHLSAAERALAPRLFQMLSAARQLVEAGQADASAIRRTALAAIDSQPELRLEYFEMVNPETLQPMSAISTDVLIAAALWLGTTRLIDNVRATPQTKDQTVS